MLLAKPLTFMNLSGRAVSGLAGFYKVSPDDLLVITDDVALPLGRLRARRGGSDGGHNGLKSITQSLGTQAFARVRVGVGRGDIQAPTGASSDASTWSATCSDGSGRTSTTRFRRR